MYKAKNECKEGGLNPLTIPLYLRPCRYSSRKFLRSVEHFLHFLYFSLTTRNMVGLKVVVGESNLAKFKLQRYVSGFAQATWYGRYMIYYLYTFLCLLYY